MFILITSIQMDFFLNRKIFPSPDKRDREIVETWVYPAVIKAEDGH